MPFACKTGTESKRRLNIFWSEKIPFPQQVFVARALGQEGQEMLHGQSMPPNARLTAALVGLNGDSWSDFHGQFLALF